MLCRCLQTQCLKTAVPAILHHCQGCSRTAALILPMPAAGVLENIPSWGWHCSDAARRPCRAHSCSSSSPEDGTETHLQPRLIYAGISAKFHSSAANRGGNSNGPYTVATQESVLYSQVNQVLVRTGGGHYRAKAAFSVSFIFDGFAR